MISSGDPYSVWQLTTEPSLVSIAALVSSDWGQPLHSRSSSVGRAPHLQLIDSSPTYQTYPSRWRYDRWFSQRQMVAAFSAPSSVNRSLAIWRGPLGLSVMNLSITGMSRLILSSNRLRTTGLSDSRPCLTKRGSRVLKRLTPLASDSSSPCSCREKAVWESLASSLFLPSPAFFYVYLIECVYCSSWFHIFVCLLFPL